MSWEVARVNTTKGGGEVGGEGAGVGGDGALCGFYYLSRLPVHRQTSTVGEV